MYINKKSFCKLQACVLTDGILKIQYFFKFISTHVTYKTRNSYEFLIKLESPGRTRLTLRTSNETIHFYASVPCKLGKNSCLPNVVKLKCFVFTQKVKKKKKVTNDVYCKKERVVCRNFRWVGEGYGVLCGQRAAASLFERRLSGNVQLCDFAFSSVRKTLHRKMNQCTTFLISFNTLFVNYA